MEGDGGNFVISYRGDSHSPGGSVEGGGGCVDEAKVGGRVLRELGGDRDEELFLGEEAVGDEGAGAGRAVKSLGGGADEDDFVRGRGFVEEGDEVVEEVVRGCDAAPGAADDDD